MKVAVAIFDGRLAPVFPGVELKVFDESEGGFEKAETVESDLWAHLAWGSELMRRDVGVLFCSGIDQFLCGSLRGYGIEVVSGVVGLPDEVINKWSKGLLSHLEVRPCSVKAGLRNRARRGRRRKFNN